jgi:DNA-binding NarL/FixJ family response regulator
MSERQPSIQVGLVSPNGLLLTALHKTLMDQPDITPTLIGLNPESMKQAARMPVHLVVVDVDFARRDTVGDKTLNTIGFLREVYHLIPHTPVVAILKDPQIRQITALYRMQVSAIVARTDDCLPEVTRVIRCANAGSLSACRVIKALLLGSPPPPPLTERELEVAQRLVDVTSGDDETYKSIAHQLRMSTGTLKTHVKHLRTKFNARSNAEVVRICQSSGLVA